MLVEGMDHEMLMEHLKQAEHHLDRGRSALEHQRGIVERLRRDCHSEQLIAEAENLLRTFEDVQSMHLADATRLRAELAMST